MSFNNSFGKAISPATHAFQYALQKTAYIISYSVENEFTLWSCNLLGDLEREDRHRRTEKTDRQRRDRNREMERT